MSKTLVIYALFLGTLLASCGSAKHISELSYKDKRTFDHYYLEGSKQKLLNNNRRAIAQFNEALKVFPASHAAHYQLGTLHYLEEEYIKAEEYARQAVELNPKYNHWYYGQHAQILNKLGRFMASAATFEIMISNEKENGQLYMEAVNQYLNASKPSKAIETLDRLEANLGITEQSATRKEYIYMRVGKPEMAVKSIERLVEAYPDNNLFIGFLSETYINAGKKDKAIEILEELWSRDRSMGRTAQLLYQLYGEQGKYEKTHEFAVHTFEAMDVPIGDKLRVFTPYFMQLKYDDVVRADAIELSDILMRLYPEKDVPYVVKGDIYNAIDSLQRSRNYFKQAVMKEGADFNTWNKLLSMDAKIKRLDWQIEDSDLAIERFPNIPGFYISKAYALYDHKQFAAAIETCDEGLEIALDKQDKLDFYSCKALAYDKMDMVVQSEQNYDRALALDTTNALIMNNYAYALAERGRNLEYALELAEKAVQMDRINPFYLDTKAWVLFKLGRHAEAIPVLEKAIIYDPESAEYYKHMYQIYEDMGNDDKAAQFLEEWNKRKPENVVEDFPEI